MNKPKLFYVQDYGWAVYYAGSYANYFPSLCAACKWIAKWRVDLRFWEGTMIPRRAI